MKITVNKREMKFDYSDGIYRLPVLSSVSKSGKVIRWEIYVVDQNKIMTDSYYYPDGKHKISSPTVVVGKNIGRSNQTTDNEQALFTAYSRWLKKQDQDYGIVGVDEPILPSIRPMLANKYTERGKKYLTEPFGVSPKLDGIRAVSRIEMDNAVLRSRNGKKFTFLLTIKEHLESLLAYNKDFMLDGELYSHDLTFNEISGITRASKTISPLDSRMEYWIFDLIYMDGDDYYERMEQLKEFENLYNNKYNKNDRVLKFVYYENATHDQVKLFHDQYVNQGYEGIMCRKLVSPYQIGNRSNYLLKYKEFEDEEFEIVGYKTGDGGEEGAIIYTCRTLDGNDFDIRPRGSIDNRRVLYLRGDTFIGKKLTVRFQEKDSTTGVPRFPVGITVRDYE